MPRSCKTILCGPHPGATRPGAAPPPTLTAFPKFLLTRWYNYLTSGLAVPHLPWGRAASLSPPGTHPRGPAQGLPACPVVLPRRPADPSPSREPGPLPGGAPASVSPAADGPVRGAPALAPEPLPAARRARQPPRSRGTPAGRAGVGPAGERRTSTRVPALVRRAPARTGPAHQVRPAGIPGGAAGAAPRASGALRCSLVFPDGLHPRDRMARPACDPPSLPWPVGSAARADGRSLPEGVPRDRQRPALPREDQTHE
jgi:hypothetical protein